MDAERLSGPGRTRRLAGDAELRPFAPVDRRLRAFGDDVVANRVFVLSLIVAAVVLAVVGRHQWFTRDDWAIILSREKIADGGDLTGSYFAAQDGHWMTVPVAIYRAIRSVFGIDTYWPYLAVAQLAHLGIVVAVRLLCARAGVNPWTATLLCASLAVFGHGWENLVFAVQITYNLSLLAFLVQVLLVDHDGPVGRRDIVGSVIALVGAASSGFGPFFVVGVAGLLLVRRRWIAAAVAAIPSIMALAWWSLVYGADTAADARDRPLAKVPEFVHVGALAIFDALTPIGALTGVAAFATLVIVVWRARDPRSHELVTVLVATAAVMLLGIAIQRVGFGVEFAASSRYVYVGSALIVPAFGLAVDQLARLGRPVLLAGWVLLGLGAGLQSAQLWTRGDDWAALARAERQRLELIAGVELPPGFDTSQASLPLSPDVRVSDLPGLVAANAIRPRAPLTPAEEAFVAAIAAGTLPPGP